METPEHRPEHRARLLREAESLRRRFAGFPHPPEMGENESPCRRQDCLLRGLAGVDCCLVPRAGVA